MNKKCIITKYDLQRVKALKRLLIKDHICAENLDKIEVLIKEFKLLKQQVIPVFHMDKVIAIVIPVLTVFLGYFMQDKSITDWRIFLQCLF